MMSDKKTEMSVAEELRQRAAELRALQPWRWVQCTPAPLSGQECAVLRCSHARPSEWTLTNEAQRAACAWLVTHRVVRPHEGLITYNDRYAESAEDVAVVLEKTAAWVEEYAL